MSAPEPTITVDVDVTNPGQFFACCGLLELADRLSPGAEGWFDEASFHVQDSMPPKELLEAITSVDLQQLDADDDMASPMRLADPFGITLDWWTDQPASNRDLKVWAGSMRSVRIAVAMQKAIGDIHETQRLFDYGAVVYDPEQVKKKVEPYYFDSRRGRNAQSVDIGFATDSLKMKTSAFPAIEFLCLVGLQRFRPAPTDERRVFEYCVWGRSLPVALAAVACSGVTAFPDAPRYRFENSFRTNQKKHKAFLPATPIGGNV